MVKGRQQHPASSMGQELKETSPVRWRTVRIFIGTKCSESTAIANV